LDSALVASLAVACKQAGNLQSILEEEFAALGQQDLVGFENLQKGKEQILADLGVFVNAMGVASGVDQGGQLQIPEDAMAAWLQFEQLMAMCKVAHRRNELLIRNKLQSITSALAVLQGSDASSGVEVYDRLGRMSGIRRGRGYHDA